MTDIALLLAPDGSAADFGVVNGDLALDDTLQTAVIHSLLADRVADAADNVPAGADRGGWWGDAYLPPLADGSPDYWGSKLWLYRRCTATQANANAIAAAMKDALAWMISDGVAADVTVTTAWAAADSLAATIAISQITQGGIKVLRQFNLMWNAGMGTLVAA